MAIEIIPKPPIKIPGWLNFLLYFSIALLIATILSYFIINNSLKRANLTTKELEEALAKTPQEIALEAEILGYQKKIQDILPLIDLHLAPSHFFEFLEKVSHPRIWFSTLSLWSREAEVKLSGQAENFSALGQQILALKKEAIIKSLRLSGVSLGEGGRVNFNLDLSLSPEIFKF